MDKFQKNIMALHFKSIAKRFVLLAFCVAVVGGGVSAFLLQPQIHEVVSFAQSAEESDTQKESERQEGKFIQEYGHSQNREREEKFTDWEAAVSFTEPTTAAKTAAGITVLLSLLLFAAYWLLIAAWLYQSAVNANMNGLIWTLLGLTVNLGAVLLFIVARSVIRVKCPVCGIWQRKHSFCSVCGIPMDTKCSVCGSSIALTDQYCGSCGAKQEKNDSPDRKGE